MNTAIETIANELKKVFAAMDAEVLERSKVWGAERYTAIREYAASEDAKLLRRANNHAYYAKVFAIAGGKSWYNAFDGRNLAMVEEVMIKHCASVVKARNLSIANKLVKAEVTEVTDSGFTHTRDGFHGYFNVVTNKGPKRVKIETIRAGGYNIQCLHLRTLVSVK